MRLKSFQPLKEKQPAMRLKTMIEFVSLFPLDERRIWRSVFFSKSALFLSRVLSPHSILWHHIRSQMVKQWSILSRGFKVTCSRSQRSECSQLLFYFAFLHRLIFCQTIIIFSNCAQCDRNEQKGMKHFFLNLNRSSGFSILFDFKT